MSKILRVLHVEDQERDVVLIARHLTKAGYELKSERVDTVEGMRTALEAGEWDVILCDYAMPHFDALRALGVRKEMKIDIPLLIISGTIGEAVAVEAMLAGANDYLMKDNLIRLVPAIERELVQAVNRREQKQAEEKLRENESLLSSTQRIAHIGSWVMELSDSGTVETAKEFWSDEHYRIFGFEPGEVEASDEVFYNSVHPDDRERLAKIVRESIEQKTPFDIEHRIILPDGRERILQAMAEVVIDSKTGKPLKLLGSVQDITERRRVEDALRESERAERAAAAMQISILNALPAHIALLNEEGVVVSVNEAWRRYATANVMQGSDFGVGQNYLEVCAGAQGDCAEDAENTVRGIRMVLSGETEEFTLEYPCHSPTEKRWFRLMVTPLNEGQLSGVVVMHVNITERKLAQEALRASDERLRLLFEQMKDGFYYSSHSGQLLDVNPAMVEMFGYSSREEMLNVDVTRDLYFSPEDRKSQTLDDGRETSEVYRMRRKDGSSIWVEDRGQYKYDEEGNVAFHQGLLRDVTERRLAEASLIRSAQRYRDLVENAYDMIYTRDMDGNITSINAAGVKLTGYPRQEFLQMNLQQILNPEDWARVQELIARKVGGKEESSYEMDILAKGGGRITLEVNTTLMYRAGVAVGVQGIARDITERKRTEEAMRESEERYRLLFDNNPFPMWVYDLETFQFLAVNDAASFFYGYSHDEFLRMNIKDIRPEKDISALVADVNKAHGVIDGPAHWQHLKKDGTLIDVEITSHELTFSGRDSRLILANDITVRKRAEEKLVRSEERYRDLIENAYDMIYTRDMDGNFTSINAAGENLTGYTRQEFLQMNMQQILGPEDWERVRELIALELAGNKESSYEMDILAKDGRRITIDVNTTLMYRDGVPVGVQGIARDITERKRIENQLIESESHKGAILESALDCIIAIDDQGLVTEFNPAAETVFGYSRADAMGNQLAELIIPPAMRDQHHRGMQHYHATGEGPVIGKRFETSAMRSNGSEFPVELAINAVQLSDSTVFTAYIRDISERKLAEASLIHSEQRYRDLVENAHDIIYSLDLEGNFISLNNAGERIVGYTLEEIVKMNFSEVVATEHLDHAKNLMEEKLSGVEGTSYEIDIIAKNSRQISLEVTSKLAKQGGVPVGIQGIARDVTERKAAREQLEQSSALLRIAGQAAHLGGWRLELPERTLTWSDENCSIHDVLPGYIPTLEEGIASYYPENRAEVLGYVNDCAENGIPYDFELPIITAKGRHVWIRSIGEAVRDTDGKIIRLQGAIQDITDRKKAEESLRQKDLLIRMAGKLTQTGGWAIELPENQVFWSDELSDILEFPRDEIPDLSKALDLFPQPGRDRVVAGLEACSNDGTSLDIEVEIITGKGRRISVRLVAEADRKADGTIERIHGAFQDISDRRQTEDQLRQAQKLESVGRLAGGIAHDFNNMLTAINGYSDLTLRQMKADDPLRKNIQEVKKAGERSAALTNQLLAFSRQQILQPEVVYLNRIITETSTLLERMIGEDVELITVLDPTTGQVKADPGQVSQIIMNLAVNARDAMPRGGKLTFETTNIFLDQEYTDHHAYVLPGAYVKLTVSDNGIGMDAETQQRIFEPFFTTKATGEGTGLGLAMVYGVVKQSGGHIMVYSEPGMGTTFTIYLPRVMEASEEVGAAEVSDELPKGTETILLVEDEEAVRSLTRQILEMCGYTVLDAANGKDALVVCENNPGRIDLLMTDVVMPEMGGRELAEKVSLSYPQMVVLFTSGYTDDAVVRHGVIAEKANFIQKPFSMEGLAHKIRSILDESMAS